MKNSLKKYCFFALTALLVFANSLTIHCQEYREVFTKKYDQSKDSAKAYANTLIKSNDFQIKAFGYISKAQVETGEGNYEKAQESFNLGFSTIEKIENNSSLMKEKMNALYHYSLFLLAKHDMEEANEKINEGLELSMKLNDAKMQIIFKNLIGRGYSMSKLGKRAIANGVETINKIKELKSELPKDYYNDQLLRTYLNTGYRNLFFYEQDSIKNAAYLDSTSYYLQSAEAHIKEENFTPSKIRQRQIVSLKADILYDKKDYQQAIEYYQKTLDASKSLGLKKRVYQSLFMLGKCYFLIGEYRKAKEVFDQISSEDLKQYKLLKNAVSIKFYYAQIYAKLGDFEKALKYTDTFNIQIEDFYQSMNENTVDVLTQNELNEKKRILNNLAEKEKTNDYLIIILLSIFLLSILLVIHARNQRKKFQLKMNDLLLSIEKKNKDDHTSVVTVKEEKAQKLLSRLSEIEKQKLFLNKNYSLNMLAKKIDSNSSYVSQIINTYWGKSFVEYTNELRINYIIQKLKEDTIYQKFTLIAIAESIGYKSLSSFNKHFKNIAGVTPKQYLNYLRANSEK